MAEGFSTWIGGNKVELLGALMGILYIFFSIRQHILTWPVGLLTSLLYIIVFFRSGFYADMGLQFYYVFISIYGWYYWLKGGDNKEDENLPVRKISGNTLLKAALATLIIYALLLLILIKFTDSTVPFMDSFTTALSIIATWMLAKKYIEHWFIWIVVDTVSAGLYVYKNLWPTVILFLIYTIMAAIGYLEWKKDYEKQENKIS
jgi:nicotinamide mononucleotide transporter